ncbi:hypothetical protein FB567DRAFT_37372 [Paraphoma chrysanthemicola]|uniref:C2H2-type domain-containing protein n=1 Tax=Paraphoma chrysanthemicola TaxID=798071 RepID=A0A8K0RJP4_9PLEO|nr:hypothetical protein FB567DRAFT_37372 [Paraphoma chrysanthemicola]
MTATSLFHDASRDDNVDRLVDESALQGVGHGFGYPSGLLHAELNRPYFFSIDDEGGDNDDDPSLPRHQAESPKQLDIVHSGEQYQPLTSHSLAGLQDAGATAFLMENWIQGHDQHAPFSDRLFSRGITESSTLPPPPLDTTRAANPESPAPAVPHDVSNVQTLLPPTSNTPADLGCPSCSKIFAGDYRRGNLLRHMRLKHSGLAREYHCEAEGCERVFRRHDARLKHYRNKHPNLYSVPARRGP